MGRASCYACGGEIEAGMTVTYRIVPADIASLYGVSDTRTVPLCPSCAGEVEEWYRKRVSTLIYDDAIKRFRARSATEMVKECECALSSFAQYQRKRRKKPR
jgi:hypothetical protein